MSDPVTNVEIEDVLSSIRRLVSENGRAPTAAAPALNEFAVGAELEVTEPEPQAELRANKLVLTEALRVAENPSDNSVSDQGDASSAAHGSADLRENEPSSIASDASFLGFHHREASPIEFPKAPAQEADKPQREERAIDLSFESRRLSFEAISDELQFDLADRSATDVNETTDTSQNVVRPWEIEGETLSDWRSETSQIADTYEPDTAGDSDYAGTEVAALQWDEANATQVDADHEPIAEVVSEGEDPSEAELDPVERADLPEVEVVDISAQPIETEPEIEDLTQETVLDEQMLRELVGEIVRQELQGPLGERITRNVRKLVRREINRAMAARNLNGDY
ncbi:hypothetical protein NBRC116601_17170 [Cognatishimia sp. WU-CL00825]|uniref:hypothetical protein n=1 Tax=Cognatishimia sp. WU-CL00825 TaxID=3127658 RepID=UPI003105DCC4